MTAMWQAGPPKLRAATRTHTQKASRNETPWLSVVGAVVSASEVYGTMPPIKSRSRATACGLLLGPTPAVERVIDDHALREHRVIVGEIDLESLRDGKQPRRLRCQIGTPRIGTAYDQGEAIERRIVDLLDPDAGSQRED